MKSCQDTAECSSCFNVCENTGLDFRPIHTHCLSECALNTSHPAHLIMEAMLVCFQETCDYFESHSEKGTQPTFPIQRFTLSEISFAELLETYLDNAIPFILTDPIVPYINLSSLPPRGGQIHSVSMIDAEQYAQLRKHDFPLSEDILWTATSIWGGALGQGAPRHLDSVCDYGFAIQLSGMKKWRLHRSSDENIAKNVPGMEVYEGVVSEGELLIFAPWHPHETILLRSHSFSLHGSAQPRGRPFAAIRLPRCSRDPATWTHDDL